MSDRELRRYAQADPLVEEAATERRDYSVISAFPFLRISAFV
jgi:hypothetical protein